MKSNHLIVSAIGALVVSLGALVYLSYNAQNRDPVVITSPVETSNAPTVTPPESAPTDTANPSLEQRFLDYDWRFYRTTQAVADKEVSVVTLMALIGGTRIETPTWFALVRAVWEHDPVTRSISKSECNGTVFNIGSDAFVITAGHCLLDRDGKAPLWIETCVQPSGRERCRASFRNFSFAVDAAYEADGQGGYRYDKGIYPLAHNPGGGQRLPQAPQAELHVGNTVRILAQGLDGNGQLLEATHYCDQPVVDVRHGMVQTDGTACRIARADSGSPAGVVLPNGEMVITTITSNYNALRPTENFFAPIDPPKQRNAAYVFKYFYDPNG